jgi:hypothetical protein
MAGWTLLVWAAVATVLVPLSSGLLGWQLLRGSRAVVGNEALVGWLLTPLGLLYLLMAGGLTLTAAVVRYAGLFHIVTDDMEGRPTSVRRTALRLAPRLPALFRLCVVAVAAGNDGPGRCTIGTPAAADGAPQEQDAQFPSRRSPS